MAFFLFSSFKSGLDQITRHQNPLDFGETKPDDLDGLNPGSLTVSEVPKYSSDRVISYFMEML